MCILMLGEVESAAVSPSNASLPTGQFHTVAEVHSMHLNLTI